MRYKYKGFRLSWKTSVSRALQGKLEVSTVLVAVRIDKTRKGVVVTVPRLLLELKCKAVLTRKLETVVGAI